MLKVVSPADDLSLLDIEGLRIAAGLAADDVARDDELTPLGLRLSAEIVSACRVAVANGGEPTLRREGLEETFRYPRTASLMLSRRHQVEVAEIVVNGQVLDAELYWTDEESGILRLVSGGSWFSSLVVVTYEAGFDEVPADLKGAVADLARVRLSEASRDPLVRGQSSEVPGVLTERTDFWVGSVPGGKATGLPSQVMSQLRRYKNVAFV